MTLLRAEKNGQTIRHHDVVLCPYLDKGTSCDRDGFVQCSEKPFIFFVLCKMNAWIRGVLLNDFNGVVRRTIVDYDEFKFSKLLMKNGLNGVIQKFNSIVYGQYDRYHLLQFIVLVSKRTSCSSMLLQNTSIEGIS